MPLALAAALLVAAGAPPPQPFVDPLDVPAPRERAVASSPLQAVAETSGRLVAVGQRGLAAWSEDGGATWTQADVPVSTDLVALRFVSAQTGWAAGHDGVVLRTRDGGRSWTRQVDGRSFGPDEPSRSILDLWFGDERSGVAVGAFGLLLVTEDGGESWSPSREGAENPRQLHLFAVAGGPDGALWIAGEQGLLLRRAAAGGRFRAVPVPYDGTLFGVTACGRALVAWGLRGNAVRTEDGGRSWRRVNTGLESAITGGAVAPDGRMLLLSVEGEVVSSEDCGSSFRHTATAPLGRASGIAAPAPATIVVVGSGGARSTSSRRGD